MTDLHHGHDTHDTIVTDREGPATALIVTFVLLLVAFLIWLFAFSNAFDANDEGDITITDRGDRQEQTDTNTNPPAGDTDTDTDTEPAPSP